MRGNTFGRFLTLTTFGESHGVALGAIIDGCPAGITLDKNDFVFELSRRRPGSSALVTSRQEQDNPEILSGIFEDKTTGTPIAVIVRNTDTRSGDYSPQMNRPGHADFVWEQKYGHRDWRGGGRSSGRETLARVIGGVVAQKILPSSFEVCAFTHSIGTHVAKKIPSVLKIKDIDQHPTRCPDPLVANAMERELLDCKAKGDSRGGVVEIWIDGIAPGLGEPVFRKLKSELSSAFMSIGGTMGVVFGDGFESTQKSGMDFHANKELIGGLLGGLSNGDRIKAQIAFKPTSTLGEKAKSGRHDPCIVPRAVPVVEAMAKFVLADLCLEFRLNH